YHIVTSDVRSIAHILARHGTLPSRAFLMNVLQGEAAALDALSAFARPLEMTDRALADVEPIPAAHAYGAYMAWLAMYASDAELAGALLVNFAAWGANCGRMSRALRDRCDSQKLTRPSSTCLRTCLHLNTTPSRSFKGDWIVVSHRRSSTVLP